MLHDEHLSGRNPPWIILYGGTEESLSALRENRVKLVFIRVRVRVPFGIVGCTLQTYAIIVLTMGLNQTRPNPNPNPKPKPNANPNPNPDLKRYETSVTPPSWGSIPENHSKLSTVAVTVTVIVTLTLTLTLTLSAIGIHLTVLSKHIRSNSV